MGQLLVAHPHDVGGIPVGKLWWLPGDQQVRTRDVDVFVEFDSDGLTGDRLLELGRLVPLSPCSLTMVACCPDCVTVIF